MASIDFYELFFNDDGLTLIVKETNRYTAAKDDNWLPMIKDENWSFFGLCLQMGVVKLPKLRDYWSSRPAFDFHPLGAKVLPRTWFEKILSNLHLANNLACDRTNRLYKNTPLLDLSNQAQQRVYQPGRNICINFYNEF